MGIFQALREGWTYGREQKRKIETTRESFKDVEPGMRKTIYTYQYWAGGNMTYHSATIVKKNNYGVTIAPGSWVTSKRYDRYDQELDGDLRAQFGLPPSSEPHVRSSGMSMVQRELFIPYTSMRRQKEYIPEA